MSQMAPKTMLVNSISAEPANLGKALRMSRKFLGTGWDVTLFLNVDGVRLIDPSHHDRTCPVTEVPLIALLGKFLAEGGRALVGAECMKLAGLDAGLLPDGVAVADFPAIEELLGRPEIKTMTW